MEARYFDGALVILHMAIPILMLTRKALKNMEYDCPLAA
jgi:hypothetical protein